MPTFVYIDEFADYAKNANEKIDKILAQARKRKIGMITAFQQFSKLSQQLQDSVISLSSIRLAGGCERESNLVARSLHTKAEFIDAQPVLTFASWIKGTTESAIPLRFQPDDIGKQPKMTKEEAFTVKEAQRDRYRSQWTESDNVDLGEDDETDSDEIELDKAAEDPATYETASKNASSDADDKKQRKESSSKKSSKEDVDPDNPSVEPSDEF